MVTSVVSAVSTELTEYHGFARLRTHSEAAAAGLSPRYSFIRNFWRPELFFRQDFNTPRGQAKMPSAKDNNILSVPKFTTNLHCI